MLTARLPVDKFGIARFVSDAATTVIRAPRRSSMNLRLAVSVVFVGTLAYACGPQSRTTVTREGKVVTQQGLALASIGGSAAPTAKTVEKTVKSASTSLTTKFDVSLEGGDVLFNLRVANGSKKNVEVNFPSGQSYDFVVLDSVGREVWRWSADRIFTSSVRNKLLSKGDAITASERWSPAKPGKWTAIAQLTSSNYPVADTVAFLRK
jgi:hypothetical protein